MAKKYTPSEALELIENYPIEINVGDEIETSGGCRGIVTNTDTHYHIFFPENGKTWKIKKSEKNLLTKISENERIYSDVWFKKITEKIHKCDLESEETDDK